MTSPHPPQVIDLRADESDESAENLPRTAVFVDPRGRRAVAVRVLASLTMLAAAGALAALAAGAAPDTAVDTLVFSAPGR
ncbi:hypothetical protein [Actinomadura sp. 6N118]|uniref:hypothetical protein n=1 Tax=Actinomadura sp. 6N118 TaxID=3375151 RepID=UPI0037BDFB7C